VLPSLFPELPCQFLHIQGESSTASAGLRSDHRKGRNNLEHSIIWFATMQPGRDQSAGFTQQFQLSQYRCSDEDRADICPRVDSRAYRSASIANRPPGATD
jgi:hypothetical protein